MSLRQSERSFGGDQVRVKISGTGNFRLFEEAYIPLAAINRGIVGETLSRGKYDRRMYQIAESNGWRMELNDDSVIESAPRVPQREETDRRNAAALEEWSQQESMIEDQMESEVYPKKVNKKRRKEDLMEEECRRVEFEKEQEQSLEKRKLDYLDSWESNIIKIAADIQLHSELNVKRELERSRIYRDLVEQGDLFEMWAYLRLNYNNSNISSYEAAERAEENISRIQPLPNETWTTFLLRFDDAVMAMRQNGLRNEYRLVNKFYRAIKRHSRPAVVGYAEMRISNDDFNSSNENINYETERNRINRYVTEHHADLLVVNEARARTGECNSFITYGSCRDGNACRFLHDERRRHVKVNVVKQVDKASKLCVDFVKGCCKKGKDCEYSHSEEKKMHYLAAANFNTVCNHFNTHGRCMWGDTCKFKHVSA